MRDKRTPKDICGEANGCLDCLTSVLCRLSSLQNRLSEGDTPIKPRLKVKQATRTTPLTLAKSHERKKLVLLAGFYIPSATSHLQSQGKAP